MDDGVHKNKVKEKEKDFHKWIWTICIGRKKERNMLYIYGTNDLILISIK